MTDPTFFRCVSWNVNSIKARLDHVLRFLKDNSPDVLLLQELKGIDCPDSVLEEAGYNVRAVTQKAYNGVAILSKHPMTNLQTKLPGDPSDTQARYIEADINGLRIINIYLPNGNPVGEDSQHEKFLYKLNWMDRLIVRVQDLRAQRIPFLIGGDFNIIPEPRDCHEPKAWDGDAAFHPETLKRYRTLLNVGLNDSLRIHNQSAQLYSFWDYQKGAWQKNNGIRIDHFLTSPQVTDRVVSCAIDTDPRGWEKPSDHTPVVLTLTT